MTSDIDTLSAMFAKLPGLGARSGRRAVLHLLKHRDALMYPLAKMIEKTADSIKTCHLCGNLDTADPCSICTDAKRDQASLCIVEEVADLWAMERGGLYRGLYHILGGTLSAMDRRGPEELRLPALLTRIEKQSVQEVILATNATVDGQTTAFYISDMVKPLGVKVSRLAYGIPVGSELDYLDEGTLGAALKSRTSF